MKCLFRTNGENRSRPWLCCIMACSAAWAMQLAYGLTVSERWQNVADLLLTASLFCLFSAREKAEIDRPVKRHARVLAVVFMLLSAFSGEWMHILKNGPLPKLYLDTLYYINAFIGTFLLYDCALALLMQKLSRVPDAGRAEAPRIAPRRAFFICFAACVVVYMLFLLNQYPGAMESDHMRQLLHALNGYYENRNPLVNSMLVLGCCRLVQLFGGSINGGIFLYSIVQLTLVAAVFSYGTSLIARAGFSKRAVLLSVLFFALAPENVFFSYGMWKDTFFAAWLILTVLKLWSILIKQKEGAPIPRADWALLFFFALVTALSRNSGWSALLVFLPCLFAMAKAFPFRKRAVLCIGGGVAAALLIAGPLFTRLGVDKTADSITVTCVPIQQVAAVVKAEKELTGDQAALLAALAPLEDIRAQYDPACADPMKDLLYPHIDVLDASPETYAKLWIQLGFTYPLTYLRAYRDLMRPYFDVTYCPEGAYRWIYPNSFGAYRDPKLLPALDFGYYEGISELPVLGLLNQPAACLLSIVLFWSLCALRKNRFSRLFYVPFLAVFGGLFLTAPVALCRYVYSAMAAVPFLVCWPFWRYETANAPACSGEEPAAHD